MNSRMSPQQRGKWDDLIAWLKRFEELLNGWRKHRKAVGMFNHLTHYHEHARAVEGIANAFNWKTAAEKDKDRTMNWILVGEARADLINEMEGSTKYSDEYWLDNTSNVHNARLWFERNNEPEESPVKY